MIGMSASLPRSPSPLTPQDAGIQKVGALELFLDLVFVFAVTQVTGTVAHPHGWETYAQAALMFLSLMWMYSGFTWLSSNTDLSDDLEGWMMFFAMAGFLLMSMAIPAVWTNPGAGALFGAGLIIATVVHIILFSRTRTSSAQAIFEVAGTNLLSAVLVMLSSFCAPALKLPLWGIAVLVFLLPILVHRADSGFSLSARHFAERNGLLIIIALGESVMAVGSGVEAQHLHGLYLGYALLGLLLAASLWWSYFGPDNERAEHALVQAVPTHRSRLALHGYGFAHYAMLAGIILAAAGLEVAIHAPSAHAHAAPAWNLAGGLALYFLGDVYFRRVMGIGPSRLRGALALALLATVWVGLHLSSFWQLVACVVLIQGVITLEDYVLEKLK